MLYVFHVDCGRMMKFDMNLALANVQCLKEAIERMHGIPAVSQVLLVSGGEILLPTSLVCSYSAGTDTNPIFMFTTVELRNQPQPWPSIEPDVVLKEQVDRCLDLPASYSTVVTRAQLAKQICDLAHEEENVCEKLVHEQHLQQQGWSAVIANMEDLTEEFQQRYANFCKCFDEHLRKRNEYCQLLEQFGTDLDNLSRIPILPGLMQNAEEKFHGFDEILENEVFTQSQPTATIKKTTTTDEQSGDALRANEENQDSQPSTSSDLQRSNNLTLLQWISAKENQQSLKIMAEECSRGVSLFDEEKINVVRTDVQHIINAAEKEEIKEIKGLEDRLCGLEKLMFELKKIVNEQRELSTAFQQNQNRAGNLGDPSILPDLCASHRSQLLVMIQSQKVIRDYRRRISKAKEELGSNLYQRLKYIVHIENTMSELDNTLLFYHRYLRRVERHLCIIQQIHQAPTIYVSAVFEVVRRRLFSTAFSEWASNLACDLLRIYSDEITRRQEFNTLFEGHFLSTLFPGMDDLPPAFASETPYLFDESLPKLTKNDIDMLSSYLPEVTSKISLMDMGSVIEFFNSRSGIRNLQERSSLTGRLQSIGGGHVIPRPIDIHSHLRDGCESETDTEEFEKVGQSPNERNLSGTTATAATSTSQINTEVATASTSTDPVVMHTVETLTEDNLGSTTLEVERLRALFRTMSKISTETLGLLRNQLQCIKNDSDCGRQELQGELIKLSKALIDVKFQYESKERHEIERVSTIFELTLDGMQMNLNAKDEKITDLILKQLELENTHTKKLLNVTNECKKLRNDITELRKTNEILQIKLNTADNDREKAIQECREKLLQQHKTEIESLRCRFKLMTSMERSPSDTSLEKIERPDVIEIACHELILQQTREDFKKEKELAIEQERAKWLVQNSPPSSLSNTTEILKKIIDEKEKLLDDMRRRDEILFDENTQLKLRIQALSTEEDSDMVSMKDKIDYLNKDNARLEQELCAEKTKRLEMESSVATLKVSSNRETGTSPEPSNTTISRSKMTSSSHSIGRPGVMTESCTKGDLVFVVWNRRHEQFVIVQDSTTMYFLHGDSHGGLNLRIPSSTDIGLPEPYFCMGRVIDKEYCIARKDENRYRVKKGTKFYRIKVQPLTRLETSRHHRRERCESSSSSIISIPVSRSTSTQRLIDSFAQTDRDVVDSAVYRERTISVTTDEDEEQISLLSDRYRYVSVSEEDERTVEEAASQNTTFGSIGIFTLIEPLLSPLQINMDM